MAITIKYTKSQYLAKISELEGYYNMLAEHLARMQDLKSKMFEFWKMRELQDKFWLLKFVMCKTQWT